MDGCDIRAMGHGNRNLFTAEDAKDAEAHSGTRTMKTMNI
jgi:hypothetical protein